MKKDEFKKWVEEHEDELFYGFVLACVGITGMNWAYEAGANSVYKQMQAECRHPILIKHVIHKR